ncbi:MAG: DUF1571 domain-containing protein [Phycisphaerae bacterium]|nr:DUF1571 domain-containing protein [Phycisphaerae bacterium]
MKHMRRGVGYYAASAALLMAGAALTWVLMPTSTAVPVASSAAQAVAVAAAPVAVAASAAEPASPTDPATPEPSPGMALSAFAASDPLGFSRWAKRQAEQNVGDYRCTLIKQELIEGKLSEVQKVEMRYRKNPLAVMMIWKENADQAKRVLYIPDDPEYRNKKGEPQAKVEPAGSVARMFVSEIMIELNSPRSKKASRRTIADAGFAGTYRLLELYNGAAERAGELEYRYTGEGTIDNRKTFVFERYLPESKVDGVTYVDAKMVIHIDQEYLVPTAVYSFADKAGTKLLGTYTFADIDLKPGFTAEDFKF